MKHHKDNQGVLPDDVAHFLSHILTELGATRDTEADAEAAGTQYLIYQDWTGTGTQIRILHNIDIPNQLSVIIRDHTKGITHRLTLTDPEDSIELFNTVQNICLAALNRVTKVLLNG